jgi:response regulator of citrate/malate metabolism
MLVDVLFRDGVRPISYEQLEELESFWRQRHDATCPRHFASSRVVDEVFEAESHREREEMVKDGYEPVTTSPVILQAFRRRVAARAALLGAAGRIVPVETT